MSPGCPLLPNQVVYTQKTETGCAPTRSCPTPTAPSRTCKTDFSVVELGPRLISVSSMRAVAAHRFWVTSTLCGPVFNIHYRRTVHSRAPLSCYARVVSMRCLRRERDGHHSPALNGMHRQAEVTLLG